ncbi:unnamed protein product [Enterobius vermicularis]|uniref:BACK domain-containing protein n=1 Tax=Enterobius vermicularis TaxID=51028 RepID=A0A0N4UU08_ENTVE|nr:unnamed protein product [Enterobius vermicularis]
MITNEQWEKEWMSIDRDQLTELLKSSDLVLPNEFKLWEAVQKWLMAPSHPERKGTTASPLLVSILPLIRFPFMTADELSIVERSPFVESHPKLFYPQILLAYKFHSHTLSIFFFLHMFSIYVFFFFERSSIKNHGTKTVC